MTNEMATDEKLRKIADDAFGSDHPAVEPGEQLARSDRALFDAGARAARAADAEEIAQLRESVQEFKRMYEVRDLDAAKRMHERDALAQRLAAAEAEVARLRSIASDGISYFRNHANKNQVGQWWLRQIERVFNPEDAS